ncbi:MAG: hypothetical protein PHS02_00065 [Candidatus ainarchaeum sp.]|nr:hypothetical protein [Candidatus ainarchaeum sp.]
MKFTFKSPNFALRSMELQKRVSAAEKVVKGILPPGFGIQIEPMFEKQTPVDAKRFRCAYSPTPIEKFPGLPKRIHDGPLYARLNINFATATTAPLVQVLVPQIGKPEIRYAAYKDKFLAEEVAAALRRAGLFLVKLKIQLGLEPSKYGEIRHR